MSFSSFFSPRHYHSRPLFTFARYPVRTIPFLLILHTVALVLVTFSLGSNHMDWIKSLCYEPNALLHGEWWRLITYPFVDTPSLWFILEMVMLYYVGSELEVVIGSRRLFLLYVGLILWGGLVLQLLSSFGFSSYHQGADMIHFSLFAALVMIYPGISFLFGIEARWVLLILTLFSLLEFFAAHQVAALVLFISSLGFTSIFMRSFGYRRALWQGVSLSLLIKNSLWGVLNFSRNIIASLLKPFFPKKAALIAPLSPSKGSSYNKKQDGRVGKLNKTFSQGFHQQHYKEQQPISSLSTTMAFLSPSLPDAEVTQPEFSTSLTTDQLLQKVSKSGLASLSEEERSQLESASKILMQREQGASSGKK